MRAPTDRQKLERFLHSFASRVQGPGRIYLVGGATAVLGGWRDSTLDIDLKAEPEPPGMFEAIAALKDELDLNVELASPDQFIPALPGWRERSVLVARLAAVDFFHYDPYGQALAKLQRGFDRDRLDVAAMLAAGWIAKDRLLQLLDAITPALIRYPSLDPVRFRAAVEEFCHEP